MAAPVNYKVTSSSTKHTLPYHIYVHFEDLAFMSLVLQNRNFTSCSSHTFTCIPPSDV